MEEAPRPHPCRSIAVTLHPCQGGVEARTMVGEAFARIKSLDAGVIIGIGKACAERARNRDQGLGDSV